MRALVAIFLSCASVAACNPPPRVADPNVVGPHGEHAMIVQCAAVGDCYSAAHETCGGGNFDIIQSSWGLLLFTCAGKA